MNLLTKGLAQVGNLITGGNLMTGYIPLSLGDFRLIATNDIPAIAVASGNGGNLAQDTAPSLKRVNAATDKQIRIAWAAAGVVEITQSFVYQPDMDSTKPVIVTLIAAMAGATDTPTIAVGYFEGVGDTNRGGNTAAVTGTALAAYSVTVTPTAGPGTAMASISLIPAAHGTDVLYLYGAGITYTKKNL